MRAWSHHHQSPVEASGCILFWCLRLTASVVRVFLCRESEHVVASDLCRDTLAVARVWRCPNRISRSVCRQTSPLAARQTASRSEMHETMNQLRPLKQIASTVSLASKTVSRLTSYSSAKTQDVCRSHTSIWSSKARYRDQKHQSLWPKIPEDS